MDAVDPGAVPETTVTPFRRIERPQSAPEAPAAPVRPLQLVARPLRPVLPTWVFNVNGEEVVMMSNTLEGAVAGLHRIYPPTSTVQFLGVSL